MSSFINSPKHFSTIKNNLKKILFYSKEVFYLPYHMRDTHPKIYDKAYFIEDREKELENQINEFAKLQSLCVNLQYKHHSENLDLDIEISEKEVVKNVEAERVSKTALFKLISCALYQVETEHLTELRPLTDSEAKALKFVKDIREALLEDIVYKSEEFNASDYAL